MNKVTLIGNVGREPEVRSTPSGQTLAKFSLATSYKTKGEKHTEWHNLVAWGKTAEIVSDYVGKGKQIAIIGRLQTDSWEDRETGKKMYRTDIVVENLELLGGGGDRDQGPRQERLGDGTEPEDDYDDEHDEDIPFSFWGMLIAGSFFASKLASSVFSAG